MTVYHVVSEYRENEWAAGPWETRFLGLFGDFRDAFAVAESFIKGRMVEPRVITGAEGAWKGVCFDTGKGLRFSITERKVQ